MEENKNLWNKKTDDFDRRRRHSGENCCPDRYDWSSIRWTVRRRRVKTDCRQVQEDSRDPKEQERELILKKEGPNKAFFFLISQDLQHI